MSYLTEKRLGEILKNIKPNLEFIHNKSVPNSKLNRHRPDYRCEELKLIIEFDGFQHYCKNKICMNDFKKDEVYTEMGYKVVRIPYFVQMTSELLKIIFDEKIDYIQEYEHGFIDKKAVLPIDFCERGISRFENDLKIFEYCKEDILNSLFEKLETNDYNEVLPEKLCYLFFDFKNIFDFSEDIKKMRHDLLEFISKKYDNYTIKRGFLDSEININSCYKFEEFTVHKNKCDLSEEEIEIVKKLYEVKDLKNIKGDNVIVKIHLIMFQEFSKILIVTCEELNIIRELYFLSVK